MIDLSILLARHNAFDRFEPRLGLENIKSALDAMESVSRLSESERRSALECIDFASVVGIEQSNKQYFYCRECQFYSTKRNHSHCNYCGKPKIIDTQCDYCEECCGVYHRRCSCGSHATSYCRACRLCNSCCQCERCTHCNAQPLECLSCGGCRERDGRYGCCSCSPGFRVSYEATHPSLRKNFNCKRKVGIEWEYNRTSIHRPLVEWAGRWHGRIHRDRSCGREAVTPPLAGDYLEKCVNDLSDVFKKINAVADNHCSVHVHVSATDYSWTDMFKLLKLYAVLEPMLFVIAGQHRLDSQYCAPCKNIFEKALDCADVKGAVLSVVYNKENGRLYQRKCPGKKDHGRYKALNIIPWLTGRNKTDSTVEFRMHMNTMNSATVLNWAKLCAKIVDFAYLSTYKTIFEIPNNPIYLLTHLIAPELKQWIVESVKSWELKYPPNSRRINILTNSYTMKPQRY